MGCVEVEWLGATLAVSAKQHGGVIQLTTPVQRIDRSRLGLSAKPWATADRER
ncbi:MAG: hypothetical protein HC899_38020 [Leptolyngbyaceae cyanobacterium SM1_4_3]|nr:hypothetical protein [Leptolyngbyaceae cyanobacterium SM1_4_3]